MFLFSSMDKGQEKNEEPAMSMYGSNCQTEWRANSPGEGSGDVTSRPRADTCKLGRVTSSLWSSDLSSAMGISCAPVSAPCLSVCEYAQHLQVKRETGGIVRCHGPGASGEQDINV